MVVEGGKSSCPVVPESQTDWAPSPVRLSPAWRGSAGLRTSAQARPTGGPRRPSVPSCAGTVSTTPMRTTTRKSNL